MKASFLEEHRIYKKEEGLGGRGDETIGYLQSWQHRVESIDRNTAGRKGAHPTIELIIGEWMIRLGR